MVPEFLSLLIGVAAYALYLYNYGSRLTPDGEFYLLAGRGRPVPTPYRYRWLLPRILGQGVRKWSVVTGLSLILTCPLIALFGGEFWLVAVFLWVGLPWFRLGARYPVLTDAPAMLLVLLAMAMEPHFWPLALFLTALAATCRESAPVYAAIFTLNPILLLGLLPVLVAHFVTKRGKVPKGAEWLNNPLKSAREHHLGKVLDPQWTLFPWGACLLVVFAPLHPALLLALAASYGQMLVANDTARLYQWAAPMVVLSAASIVPPEWSMAVIVAHMLNPWAGVQV